MSGISREMWLSALSEVGISDESDPDAITIMDFAALMGLKRETARGRLGALVAAGKATRTKKRIQLQDGRSISAVAYRLNEPKGARKK